MKVRFLGPNAKVNTLYGTHLKGEVREYSDAVGKELIETGVRNKFEEVEEVKESASTAAASSSASSQASEPSTDQAPEAKSKGKGK